MRIPNLISVIAALVAVACCSPLSPPPFKLLGNFTLTDPAFTNVLDFGGPGSAESLIVTGFTPNPFVKGYLYSIDNISHALEEPIDSIVPTTITKDVVWPNKAKAFKYEEFDQQVMAVAGGFLLPGHSTGAINLLHRQNGTDKWSAPHKISTDKSEWFYHIPMPYDVNGDGHTDILTARAIKPLVYGQDRGELLWLENPGDGSALTTSWKEHALFPGPDFAFTVYDVDNDGRDEVVAAEFFSKKVVVYWNWSTPSAVKATVLEDSYAPFWVAFTDLNGDGRDDLLVTSHEADANEACVYVYEIPEDPVMDTWEKHTLACGFQIVEKRPGNAAPGQAMPVVTHKGADQKPVIVLSADNANKAFLLSPKDSSPSDWDYDLTLIWASSGDIGEIATGYFGGDVAKFLVPDYGNGIMNVYTF